MTFNTIRIRTLPREENMTVDERGYQYPQKREFDTSTWMGRKMENLNKSMDDLHENQRNLGYQVYDGDPGKDPYYMDPHTQNVKVNGEFYEQYCNIL